MNRQMRRLIVSLCFAAAMLLAGGWFGVQPVYAADGMTRAEWIHNLTQVFEMTVEGDNYPDNYYSDITAANSCYRDIMVATEFGVIEVEAGQKICPDDALTREFAAYTLNYCLGFKLEDETYTYSDVDRVTDKYRPDVQIALNRGWFTLINGEFLPETPVTASEAGVMLNDAKLWIDATKIDESHRNSFEYDSEYIEVPRETSVEVDEDGLVKIYDETVSISKGDKFIVYQNELPQAFKAGTVEIIGDVIHITTEQLDINEALTEADAQGVSESDLGLVEPADGVDVYYEEETETVEFAEPSSMSYNSFSRAMMRAISGNKKVKSVKLSKKIGGNCKVDAKLSSLRVEYRIDGINDIYVAVTGDAQVTATGSFSNSGTSSITLGTINVGGIADVKIQAKMLVTGKIVITYGTDFTAGVHYTAGGFRLVKSFHKKSFTIASEIQMTTGLEASVNVDKIPGIRGKIYAEIGAKTTVSSKMRPSGNPSLCMHVVSYLYAEAGVSVTFGVSGFSKTFSKKAVIFNEKNSPVRVVWHYEDGVLKGSGCSIDPDWNYYTGLESRYGINSSGYGIDGSGEIVPIFTYTLDDDGNATITGYKGNSYLVAIPDEIDGHPVIAIGRYSFKENLSFSELVVPEGVATIEYGAFMECTKLSKVTLPESLTTLYCDSFCRCTSLSEVNIPSKLKVTSNGLDAGPFGECTALKNVTFNKGITTISNHLFKSCSGLEKIEIPETVTMIGSGAFYNCTNLTEINIPDTVKNLGTWVFGDCSSMEKAHIPEDWTEIPSDTFNGCTSLKEVNLPKSLLKIGSGAFKECAALEEVTFPADLQSIESSAYYGCSSLKKVTFPRKKEGTISIKGSVFGKCEALTDVTLSENVSDIGYNAFEYCVALEKITLPDSLRSLGACAFQYCEALTDVELGAGLTVIPESCFLADRSLVTIVCPQQMTKVEANAFKNATSFREITLNRRITSIDSTAFSYPAKLTIYGITGTYPETFAREQDITFVPLNSPATAIRLNQGEYRLARGDSFQMTALITPTNSSDELVWKSLNEEVVTVSETGMLKGISLGTAKVTATAGTVTVISEITVYEKVTGVSLDSSSKTVTAGESFWLTATVWPKEASDKSVIWRSSDENVVKVGATGCVSAVSAGKATIEVITVDGSYKKTCSVTVNDNPEPSESPAVSPAPTPSSKPSPTPGNFQDLSLKEDSALNITSDGKLTGLIQNENTVLEILEQFEAEELVVADADGNVLTGTALLGTGATISILESNTVKASCKVILAGDTNGDGKVNGKDISRLARSFVGKENLTEEQQTAADVWEDGALNGKDVSKMARSLVGKDTISSQKKPTETEEPTERNEHDVAALKALIAEQREHGATVSETIDDGQYEWENGRLISICWENTNLSGELNVTGLTALTNLECSENELSGLDVSKNVFLKTLNCSRNHIGRLDVSKNTALTNLYCYENELSGLDVSKNTVLEDLNCRHNRQLSSLDVSKNTALKWLECSYNELSSLDVSKNTVLEKLDCRSNRQLSSLDVSGCTMLIYLDCYENSLTALDVSKNTALEWLVCSCNQLISLDLTNNTKLEELTCDSDVTITGYKPNNRE